MASEAASAKLSGNRLKEPGPSDEWSRWLRDKRFGGDADYAEKYLKALDQVRGWIAKGLGEFSKAPDFPGCGGPHPLAGKQIHRVPVSGNRRLSSRRVYFPPRRRYSATAFLR